MLNSTYRASALLMATIAAKGMTVTVTPSPAPPRPVGTVVTWKAAASDAGNGVVAYRFRVAGRDGVFHMARDFSQSSEFAWNPSAQEGRYKIEATARNNATGTTAVAVADFEATSRVIGNRAAVNGTANPLVALYSAPGCPSGGAVRVRFAPRGSANYSYTPAKACTPLLSENFYVAGMHPKTAYAMTHEIVSAAGATPGPPLEFETGAMPAVSPLVTVKIAAGPATDEAYPFLMHAYVSSDPKVTVFETAVDLAGAPVWFYPSQDMAEMTHPVEGGTFLFIEDGWNSSSELKQQQLLREADLAGNVLRETNATRLSEQLAAMGKEPCGGIHHEIRRMPNGDTLLIAGHERHFPAGTQKSDLPVDVLGAYLLVLDPDFQLKWAWDAFDHLDVNRTREDTCGVQRRGGCPPLISALPDKKGVRVANNWLHANCAFYVPEDGSIVMSLRMQDWVIKIDYGNGAGTGKILWKMGIDGDFKMENAGDDPFPWFSHQHDVGYFPEAGSPGMALMTLFDNGNTRVEKKIAGASVNSRGMALRVNEVARTVRPVLVKDLGRYAGGVGSAQKLAGGNYHFQVGTGGPPPIPGNYQEDFEVKPGDTPANGTFVLDESSPFLCYRSFRMHSLYSMEP